MEEVGTFFEIAEKLEQADSDVLNNSCGFPIQDILNCLRDKVLQSQHNREDAIKLYGNMVDHPIDDCIWFWFESPDWTWENFCGRGGWLVIAKSELRVIDFFLEIMN